MAASMVPRLSVAVILATAIRLGALVGATAFLIVRRTGVMPVAPTAAAPSAGVHELGEADPRVGARAPELGLTALDGMEVKLESLRGRVVLVNFWASWCGPCEKEMADLQRLYDEERDRGFVVVGVNEGEESGRAAGFLSRFGITFPNVIDSDGSVTRRYQVFGLPNSYFIDVEGVVRARIAGPFTIDQMRGYLEQARRKQDVPPPLVRSVAAATIGDAERPAARVAGEAITLGQVNRRIDLEQAFAAVRGSVPPDLTASENRSQLQGH
jgi:peroxiredoxin